MENYANSNRTAANVIQNLTSTNRIDENINYSLRSFSENMPFNGSNGTTSGSYPNPVYFLHPETNYYEYGEVQKFICEACSVKVKDSTGSVFVVRTTAANIIGKWTAGMEIYHINPLGNIDVCFVAEDAKGSDCIIKISKESFVKTVKPEQLKISVLQMQQLISMGDAGRFFVLYSY